MSYSPEKHLVSREPKQVVLRVGDEEISIKVRGLPWSKRNQLVSQHVRWDPEGKTTFDGDGYVRDCLKFLVVEAPWGQTDDTFLSQVGDELGAALQQLVPSAFGSKPELRPEQIKKGP